MDSKDSMLEGSQGIPPPRVNRDRSIRYHLDKEEQKKKITESRARDNTTLEEPLDEEIINLEERSQADEAELFNSELTHTVSISASKEYYKNLLDKSKSEWSIDLLNVKPGDKDFVLWFTASSYFPLLAGCFGPIANMSSIAAIICNWRSTMDGESIRDEDSYFVINAVSILFGLVSNLSLYLNFKNKLRYGLSQSISLSGWIIACCILLALVVAVHITNIGKPVRYSQGYWFACMTVILYFINFMLLAFNEFGFIIKKYQPLFNINEVQRTLMSQCIFLSVWIIVGAAIFMKMMNISYGDSIYFATVTILTIGLGDFNPITPGARAVVLIWTTFGLLFFGIIISTIRELVLEYAKNTMKFHRFELARKRERKRLGFSTNKKDTSGSGVLVPENESKQIFDGLAKIYFKANRFQKFWGITLSVLITATYWLLGSLCFYLVEDTWSFGTSCYFCYLCLVTVGYGAPSPTTDGGKAFFVIWGIFAIPLMTIFISNIADLMFRSLETFSLFSIATLSGEGFKYAKKQLSTSVSDLTSGIRNNNINNDNSKNLQEDDSFDHEKDVDEDRNSIHQYSPQYLSRNNSTHDSVLRERNPTLVEIPETRSTIDGIRVHRQNSSVHVGEELIRIKSRKGNSASMLFKNENDSKIELLSDIQVLTDKLHLILEAKKDKRYTFQDWEDMLRLTTPVVPAPNSVDYRDKLFWLSDKSPLRLNFNEDGNEELQKFFTIRYLHSLEIKIQQLALDLGAKN